MRGGNIDQGMKRDLLRAVVNENVETIHGLPPRPMRKMQRAGRTSLRRLPLLLLLPLTLFGSTYLGDRRGSSLRSTAPRPSRSTRQFLNAATVETLEPISAAAFPLAVKRVVIDAGHGGNDPGTSTPLVIEKDVTLDVATRLRRLLERNGFEVIVTRGDDHLIPLRERAGIANKSDGDIFVSIHVNSLASGIANHGVETYYLGATNDPTLTRLAAQENGVSGYSLADVRRLLDGIYADVRRDESHRLADTIQRKLYDGLRGKDTALENWGVKRAPFLVLVATEMPAVLAEVGCLTDQRDVVMLQNPEYRQQIAQALFRGIHEYAVSSEKKGT